jgi:putative copper resistance protein D
MYGTGVRRLARRGRRWSPARTAAFLSGVAVLVAAPVVDDTSFTGHMVEHVGLGMLAPLLLALGAPVTLALQSGRPATTATLRSALRSRPLGVLAHPVVGWLLFGGTMVVLYFTPLLSFSQRHPVPHAALHAHLLVVGCLFLWPLVGVDPVPRRLPYGGRLLAVLVAVPFHAFVGLALVSAASPLAPGVYDSLTDQRRAAAVLWGSGELFTLVVASVVARQWLAADRREAARLDRILDRQSG